MICVINQQVYQWIRQKKSNRKVNLRIEKYKIGYQQILQITSKVFFPLLTNNSSQIISKAYV